MSRLFGDLGADDLKIELPGGAADHVHARRWRGPEDTPRDIPFYFTNGICGEDGAPPCPTDGGPIYCQSDWGN
jgi:hypothetical protein